MNAHPEQSHFNHQRSRGEACLVVGCEAGDVRLRKLYQQGCAKLRLPEKFGSTQAEAVMINSSGGMTGGDYLKWSFSAEEQTNLVVTTQACERVYKASGGTASTECVLWAGEGACLSWLPQETILFDEGRFRRTIDVELAATSELLMVEPIIFGRTAMGESVLHASLHDRWRVRREGRLIHAEDFKLEGDLQPALASANIAGGNRAIATVLLIAPRAEGLCEQVRDIIGPSGGASFWNGKLLARVLAEDGYALRRTLIPLLELLNHPAALPKIWAS